SAAALLALRPQNVGVSLVARCALDAGLNWNLEQADRLVREFAQTAPSQNVEARLAWVRWLQLRGRAQEATETLTGLIETVPPEQRRRLQLLRADTLL